MSRYTTSCYLTDYALARAIAGDWIEVLPPEASAGSVQSLRVTTVGSFGHRVLPGEFQYLDAVVVDTPVTDPGVRGEIHVVDAVAPRLARAEAFLGYLERCWADSGLEDLGVFDWAKAVESLREEIEFISSKLS